MSTIRILSTTLLATTFLVQPAVVQNKAALGKSVTDFHTVSQNLATSLSERAKRTGTASPNDKEMLKLVTNQLSLVAATADGVLALGVVAAEERDPRGGVGGGERVAVGPERVVEGLEEVDERLGGEGAGEREFAVLRPGFDEGGEGPDAATGLARAIRSSSVGAR